MPVQFHVYKIFNFEDEMIYVGQTANLHARREIMLRGLTTVSARSVRSQ